MLGAVLCLSRCEPRTTGQAYRCDGTSVGRGYPPGARSRSRVIDDFEFVSMLRRAGGVRDGSRGGAAPARPAPARAARRASQLHVGSTTRQRADDAAGPAYLRSSTISGMSGRGCPFAASMSARSPPSSGSHAATSTDASKRSSGSARPGELALLPGGTLLARTDMPIGSIAYACGFADLYHFSHRFTERYGVSPTAFRDAGTPLSSVLDQTGVRRLALAVWE
jgi:helix-turn-helix protein